MNSLYIRIYLIVISMSVLGFNVQAQLGFCNGNSGSPIFTETFGTGTTNGPALPPGTTTYTFVSNSGPVDGQYTIGNATNAFTWRLTDDHTPGDSNGKSLIVNADFTAGEFYKTTINGLCENTSYEFSAWVLNILPTTGNCPNGGIPINVKFEIRDVSGTRLLASGDTGGISGNSPNWGQYALVFQTLPTQTSVILRMLNNGAGGCGNDLAIDDIVFKSCGDLVTVTDAQNNVNVAVCEDQIGGAKVLRATPDFSVYATHAYQWQQSSDGIVWTDIMGETNMTYTTSPLINSIFYRVKVAEDAINLVNSLCNVISEVFEFTVTTKPDQPISNGDAIYCENEIQPLLVIVPSDVNVNWYDAAVGGNQVMANSRLLNADEAGSYFAEAISADGVCISDARTEVRLSILDIPQVGDETVFFCQNSSVVLNANVNNATYVWSTQEVTQDITVDAPGIYTLEVTNSSNGCFNSKTIEVIQNIVPIIGGFTSNGNSLSIEAINEGDFEYSVDGVTYQTDNVFPYLESGDYTIRIRDTKGCGEDTLEIIHFVIPKFFTPNNDGTNDTFDLEGIESYSNSEVTIFDRYGKLLKRSVNTSFSWDGAFNTSNLPAADYWYNIVIEGTKFTGHFSLLR